MHASFGSAENRRDWLVGPRASRLGNGRRWIRWIPLLGIAIGACRTGTARTGATAAQMVGESPACADTTQEVRLPLVVRDSLAPTGRARTVSNLNEYFDGLAREYAGGFGGFYAESGYSVLRFVDTTAARADLDRINARLASEYGASHNPAKVRLQRSRWSFATMYEWYRYVLPHVMTNYHMNTADVDEARNRIVFVTREKDQVPRLRALLDRLGVPCGLVILRVEPGFHVMPSRVTPGAARD